MNYITQFSLVCAIVTSKPQIFKNYTHRVYFSLTLHVDTRALLFYVSTQSRGATKLHKHARAFQLLLRHGMQRGSSYFIGQTSHVIKADHHVAQKKNTDKDRHPICRNNKTMTKIISHILNLNTNNCPLIKD